MENNNSMKIIIFLLITIIVILIGGFVILFVKDNDIKLFSSFDKTTTTSLSTTTTTVLSERGLKLKQLGIEFYESFYYQSAGEQEGVSNTEFLAKFTEVGIKVNLENLARYFVTTDDYDGDMSSSVSDRSSDFITSYFPGCNKGNTKVIFYPYAPYGKYDYKIDVVLDC